MPPRPASRCYQAMQSHTNAPAEAVWVTDDILSRALQRYIDVSRVHKRMVSYAPGPMYHRKRFGRRQMTELNSPQSAGTLPVWALSNAPDMMQWQWQPPTSDLWSSWPPPSPAPSTSPRPSPLLSPLSPPAPVPPMAPLALAPGPEPEPEALLRPPLQPHRSKLDIVEENRPRNHWKSLHDQLHNIRTNHVTSIRAYVDNSSGFFSLFQRALSEGGVSGSAAADVYKTAIRDAFIVDRRFPAEARWFRLSVLSCLASGTKSAREAGHALLLRPSDMYMMQLAECDPDEHNAELLEFAMANLRTRSGPKFYGIVLTTLNRFFDLWRSIELHGNPEKCDWPGISQSSHLAYIWAGRCKRAFQDVEALLANGQAQEARRHLAIAKRCSARMQRFTLKSASLMSNDFIVTGKIADALKGYDPEQYRTLYTQVTTLMGGENTSWSRIKYNWLQVLAQLPKITTSQFNRLLDLFARRGYAALSQNELCHLLLLHWESTGKIPPGGQTRRIWNRHRGDKDHTALAALALAVNKQVTPTACTAAFWGFWDILRSRGGFKEFLRQLSLLSKREKLSDGLLKRLAWTSNDHRIALFIHDISLRQRSKRATTNLWYPPFWEKFAGRLRNRWKHPRLDPINLIKKLLAPDPELHSCPPSPLAKASCRSRETFDELDTQPRDTPAAPLNNLISSGREMDLQKSRQKAFQMQVARLKFGLKLLVNARQITDRQVLRAVTDFTKVLANKQGYLSASDLATLTSVMMRALDKGQIGSKERFRWYLGVICRFLGEDACTKVGFILQRRRDANWLFWKRRLAKFFEDARQARSLTEQFIGSRETPLPEGAFLWEKYVEHNKRRARRRRELHAPMRMRRAKLIASCRTASDAENIPTETMHEIAVDPLAFSRVRAVG